MPTTLPERNVASRYRWAPSDFQLAAAGVGAVAAFAIVAILYSASSGPVADSGELAQLTIDFPWSSPTGFAP